MKGTSRNMVSVVLTGMLLSLASAGLSNDPAEKSGSMIRGTVKIPKKIHSKDVVVYLKEVPGDFDGDGKVVEMDQKGKIYVPHVLPILWGTKVRFKNSDTFLHNVHAYQGRYSIFNKTTPSPTKVKSASEVIELFNRAGEYAILCDIHPEMEAYILSLKNPYFTKINEDGSFEIKNVPEGNFDLVVWSPDKKIDPISVTVTKGSPTTVSLILK